MANWIIKSLKSAFYYKKGKDLLERGRFEEAEPHLKVAVESDPDSGYAKSLLGYSLFRQGRIEEAEPYLQEGARQAWYEYRPNKYLAEFLLDQGRDAEAVDPLQKILYNVTNEGIDGHEDAMKKLNDIREKEGKKACRSERECRGPYEPLLAA